jgi:hypothetical protein
MENENQEHQERRDNVAKELAQVLELMRLHKTMVHENIFQSTTERTLLNDIYLGICKAHINLTAKNEHLGALLSEAEDKPLYTAKDILDHANFPNRKKSTYDLGY